MWPQVALHVRPQASDAGVADLCYISRNLKAFDKCANSMRLLRRPPSVLMAQAYDMKPEAEGTSNRRRVEWTRDIEAGDSFDFVLHPRRTHACDGMSIIDIIVWPQATAA